METGKWKWELCIKTFTALGFIATILFGIYELHISEKQNFQQRQQEQQENVKQRQFSLYKTFWEKRFALYSEICDAASHITIQMAKFSKNNQHQIQSRATGTGKGFWHLYYGAITIVEDKTVATAMVEFGKVLRQCEAAVKSGKLASNGVQKLKAESLKLASACRDSIREYWKDFGEVTNAKIKEEESKIQK